MRLIVLYGSRACEHDVSIITAVQAMDNADPSKYTVIPVYIDMAGRWWTGDALRRMDFYTHFDERRVTECQLVPKEGGGALLRGHGRCGHITSLSLVGALLTGPSLEERWYQKASVPAFLRF